MAFIYFRQDGKDEITQISSDPFVIGRLQSCNLTLLDRDLSRQHCEIEQQDGNLYLRDLGSRNGTRINGERVSYELLHPGDEISLGNTVLRFESELVSPGPAPDMDTPVSVSLESIPAATVDELTPTVNQQANEYLLHCTEGEVAGMAYLLDEKGLTIGRRISSTIALSESSVSANHARLSMQGQQIILHDSESKNGVKVNDKVVLEEKVLKPGDVIQVGSSLFEVRERVRPQVPNTEQLNQDILKDALEKREKAARQGPDSSGPISDGEALPPTVEQTIGDDETRGGTVAEAEETGPAVVAGEADPLVGAPDGEPAPAGPAPAPVISQERLARRRKAGRASSKSSRPNPLVQIISILFPAAMLLGALFFYVQKKQASPASAKRAKTSRTVATAHPSTTSAPATPGIAPPAPRAPQENKEEGEADRFVRAAFAFLHQVGEDGSKPKPDLVDAQLTDVRKAIRVYKQGLESAETKQEFQRVEQKLSQALEVRHIMLTFK